MTLLDSGGKRSRSQQAVEVKSCEHHISRTNGAVLMKLTGITTNPYWWPGGICEVKDQGHSMPKYVVLFYWCAAGAHA